MDRFVLGKYINFTLLRDQLKSTGMLYFLLTFLLSFAILYLFLLFLPFEGEKKKKYATAIAFVGEFVVTYNYGQIYSTPVSLGILSFTATASYILISLLFAAVILHSILREEGKKLPAVFGIIISIIFAYLFFIYYPSQNLSPVSIQKNANSLLSFLTDPTFIGIVLPFAVMVGVAYYVVSPPKTGSSKVTRELKEILKDIFKVE